MSALTTWAGSYTFGARGVVRPGSLSELADVVAREDRVRALGSRHSFTDLADSAGVLVVLDRMDDRAVRIDGERRVASVPAGLLLGQVAELLHGAGWALPVLPSLPHISVAGAVATGTHGSGRSPSLSALVTQLDVVHADGTLGTLRRGEPGYGGWVVSLGALGVVHRLTLDVQPSYAVRQRVYTGLAWQAFVDNLDAVLSAGHSVSAFTDWTSEDVNQLWVKSRPEEPDPGLPGARPAAATLHMLPGGSAEAVTEQLGVAGPWHERLPHFRAAFMPSSGVELQSEYFVPRRHAVPAMAQLRRVGDRIAPLLQVSEIRTVAADDLWLSGAYDEDVVGLHFTWHRDWDGVHALLPSVEELLAPYAARPHWGKCFTLGPAYLEGVFPRLGDFRRLRAEVDPAGKFGNAFLDRLGLA